MPPASIMLTCADLLRNSRPVQEELVSVGVHVSFQVAYSSLGDPASAVYLFSIRRAVPAGSHLGLRCAA